MVWPDDRETVNVGTLELTQIDAGRQKHGDVLVFDPTRIIDAIELCDDPLLLLTSEAYSISVARRGTRTDGVGDTSVITPSHCWPATISMLVVLPFRQRAVGPPMKGSSHDLSLSLPTINHRAERITVRRIWERELLATALTASANAIILAPSWTVVASETSRSTERADARPQFDRCARRDNRLRDVCVQRSEADRAFRLLALAALVVSFVPAILIAGATTVSGVPTRPRRLSSYR